MPRFYKFDYAIRNESGEIVDSSDGSEALSFVEGDNNTIIGLQKALASRSAGDEFSVTIEPGDAYGHSQRSLVRTVTKDMFEVDDLEAGMVFQVGSGDATEVARVMEVNENSVTIDTNHPLAGVTFNFEICVLEAREATTEEVEASQSQNFKHRHSSANENT